MERKQSFSQISPTALLCAHIRAKYTDIPFSKEIYEAANSQSQKKIHGISFIINKIASYNSPAKAHMSIIERRYLAINEALSSQENPVILEIASGLSSRGLEYADKETPYIETDLPEMIRLKEGLTKKITQENISPNHHFKSLNVLNINELMATGEYIRQIAPDNPIAITQEGLFMYLTKNEKKTARDNIYKFLKKYSPNGAWITTDFSARKSQEIQGGLLVKLALKIISKNTKREFQKFADDDEVAQFLHEGNLKGVPISNHPLDYTPKIKVDKSLIEIVRECSRAWIARL